MTDTPEGAPLTDHACCPDRSTLWDSGWKASIFGAPERAALVLRDTMSYWTIDDYPIPREEPS